MKLTGSRVRTLILYASHAPLFSYLDDWLDAFVAAPQFSSDTLNICDRRAAKVLKRTIQGYELVVLLHSTNADWLHFLRRLAPILADRKGLLLSFVGNEVNLPGMRMSDKLAILSEIRPDFVATQLLPEAGEYLYRPIVRRKVASIPHALNAEAFRSTVDHAARPNDIGSRTAQYAAYLGDNDRTRLIRLFQSHPFEPALRVDIDTVQRFDRAGWAAFLNQCKGTIATEAGSWYLQRDDRTVDAIREWVIQKEKRSGFVLRSDSPLQKLAMLTPQPVRRRIRRYLRRGPLKVEVAIYDNLDFESVYERFFRTLAKAPVYSKCISSRHFDAVGTRTCQIMIEGRYNDILRADEHYLALRNDFSNIDDVMRRFREPSERTRVVDAAYEHVRGAHTYAQRMAQVAELVGA
jgi:hypothetical protein